MLTTYTDRVHVDYMTPFLVVSIPYRSDLLQCAHPRKCCGTLRCINCTRGFTVTFPGKVQYLFYYHKIKKSSM